MSDAPEPHSHSVTVLKSVSIPHSCGYLPGREATHEYFRTPDLSGDAYNRLLDHNFRRSGRYLYRPICENCPECRQIRVPVAEFRPDRTQRRILRKNIDVERTIGPPRVDDARRKLYARYLAARHADPEGMTPGSLDEFLYESCVPTQEWAYRLADRLVMVGIADFGPQFLSAVYCYFDPDFASRSLGTFNVLCMLESARRDRIPHVYLGYYIRDCRKMNYKSAFRPCEALDSDGRWVPLAD